MAALQRWLERLNAVNLLHLQVNIHSRLTTKFWLMRHKKQTLKALCNSRRKKIYIFTNCEYTFVLMAETKLLHMQNRAGLTPSQGSSLIITYEIGQNVVVTPTVLPQGHNLWERNIDTVNNPWDESKEPCISHHNNLYNCSNFLQGQGMSLHLKHSKVYCGIRWERKQLENGLIKEELIIRENTELNIPLTLNSFTVQGHESWESVGLKVEIGENNISKEFTVRQWGVDLALLWKHHTFGAKQHVSTHTVCLKIVSGVLSHSITVVQTICCLFFKIFFLLLWAYT